MKFSYFQYCNDPNAFTEYSSDMNDSYENIYDYNPRKPAKY